MLEGNIFASGGHGSSSSKRWAIFLLTVVGLVVAALATGGIGGVVDSVAGGADIGATSGGGTAGWGGAGSGSAGFSGMGAAFVFLLVGMLVVILRM
jgi:hypothetical protein